jgi:hypothetical protein
MQNVTGNRNALVEAARGRSLALGVGDALEPRMFAFAWRYAQGPDRAIVQHYVPILQHLDRTASGLDIIQAVGAHNVGPRMALLQSVGTGQMHARDWKSVIRAWAVQQTTEQSENPHAQFRMNGVMVVLASIDTHDRVREVMKTHHDVRDALSPIIEIKRFNGDEWEMVQDEGFALQMLKLCIAQGYRRQLRQPWTYTPPGGSVRLTVSPQGNVRTIVVHLGDAPLHLRILSSNEGEFGIRFTDPVVTKVAVAGSPADSDLCEICASYTCMGCYPPHTPSVLGCEKLIHRCCLSQAVHSTHRRQATPGTNCIYCFRHVDLA